MSIFSGRFRQPSPNPQIVAERSQELLRAAQTGMISKELVYYLSRDICRDDYHQILLARNAEGQTAFHAAMADGHLNSATELVKSWIKENLSPISRRELGVALYLGLTNFDPKACKELLTQSAALTRIIDRAGGFAFSKEYLPSNWQSSLSQAMLGHSGFDSPPVSFILDCLQRYRDVIGEEILLEGLNHRIAPGDHPLLQVACLRGATTGTVTKLLELGADPKVPFDFFPKEGVGFSQGTILHLAAVRNDHSLAATLARSGLISSSARDADGNTAIMLNLQALKGQPLEGKKEAPLGFLRTMLIDFQAPGHAVNRLGRTQVDLALESGFLEAVDLLLNHKGKPPLYEQDRRYEVLHDVSGDRQVMENFAELVRTTLTLRLKLVKSDELRKEMDNMLRTGRSVYDCYLYAASCQTVLCKDVEQRLEPEQAYPLLALSRSLLFRYPPGSLKHLWKALESLYDNDAGLHGWHPNEAELMLLIDHPQAPILHKRDSGNLILALTGVTRFLEKSINRLDWMPVWNLSQIGSLSLSFQHLRFEAERFWDFSPHSGWYPAGQSILERAGLTRIGERPQSDHDFGPGFVWFPMCGATGISAQIIGKNKSRSMVEFDNRCLVEERRGYDLISHPVAGTLIVRNSSRVFGRESLKHPAYWCRRGINGLLMPQEQSNKGKGFKLDDLIGLTRSTIENERQFRHILDTNLYKDIPGGYYRQPTEAINFLIRQLLVFKDYLRRWEFDSVSQTAWKKVDKAYELNDNGGFNSPGFAHIVNFLRTRHDALKKEDNFTLHQSKVLPELAFVMPGFPPWSEYRYGLPNGEVRSRVEINDDTLQVLEAYAYGNFTRATRELAHDTGLYAFFQEAGFERHGKLTMLAPKGAGHEIGGS